MFPPTELPTTVTRDPSAPSFFAVRNDPFEYRVRLFELRRELRFWQRGVFDKDANLARTDYQVAKKALGVLEVASDPHAAVDD